MSIEIRGELMSLTTREETSEEWVQSVGVSAVQSAVVNDRLFRMDKTRNKDGDNGILVK